MALIKYDPFKEMERFLEDDLFGFFPAIKRHMDPAMDMYHTEKDIVIELQVPKIDPTKINISIEEGVLKVEGGQQQSEEEKGKEYFRREIRRANFVRMVQLPTPVKENEVEATYENGILKIVLPKTEVKRTKVDVKVK